MKKVLCIDTETTGLFNSVTGINESSLSTDPHVIQLSYLMLNINENTKQVTHVEATDRLIQIPLDAVIHEKAYEAHRISASHSRTYGVPIFHELRILIMLMKKADKIVAHNAQFDIAMIRIELMRFIYGQPDSKTRQLAKQLLHLVNQYTCTHSPLNKVVCTMNDVMAVYCGIYKTKNNGDPYARPKPPKLIELHHRCFNMIPTNTHNSMVDVWATMRCYLKFKYDVDLLVMCGKFRSWAVKHSMYSSDYVNSLHPGNSVSNKTGEKIYQMIRRSIRLLDKQTWINNNAGIRTSVRIATNKS